MKRAVFCLVVTGVLLIGSLAGAQTLVTYDNFEGKTLDATKWAGGQGADQGMVTLEMSRLIKNDTVLNSKALNLSNRSYANTGSDSGHSTASTRIFFRDGSNIKTIEATVLVKKIQVLECTANPDYATEVRVRIGGPFFNTGTPTSGDSTNDVWGQITVGRTVDSEDPVGKLHIYGRVYHCNNGDCSSLNNIGDRQDLGTVKLNAKVKVRVTWDQERNEFIFQKGKGDPLIVSYGVTDGSGPGGAKRLEVQNLLPNCPDEPWLAGYIDASFDNVKTNLLP